MKGNVGILNEEQSLYPKQSAIFIRRVRSAAGLNSRLVAFVFGRIRLCRRGFIDVDQPSSRNPKIASSNPRSDHLLRSPFAPQPHKP
jgi:hypothetical protein